MKVTITKTELDKAYIARYQREEKYKTGVSGMGDIAEDLGECTGNGTMDGEIWYYDAIGEAEDYALKQYNFEEDILAMDDDRYGLLVTLVREITTAHISRPDGDPHTLAAYVALKYPLDFAEIVKLTREALGDGDMDDVAALFPDFVKERQRCADSTAEDMRRDFVRGDYGGNFEGVERATAKLLGAEDVTVEGYDAVTIEWNEDDYKDRMRDNGNSTDPRRAKSWAINELIENAAHHKEKRRVENEKRREEYERVAAYQKERDEKAAEERRQKIDAIRIKN